MCGIQTPRKTPGLCTRCYSREWYRLNPEKMRLKYEKSRRKRGVLPMSENRSCAPFLGIHIAEQVLSKVFKNIKIMPPNNPGYDFICNKNMKIDVKSSCMRLRGTRTPTWEYHIFKNTVADYFLCIAFNNRTNLNPLHLWLIPSNVLNTHNDRCIAESTLSKWDKYALPIDKVITCCDTLR